ncbi:hypothetical protein E2C01_019301 [Portunus trituberculatus]|uniref:Uncharacterized protein n=1 Tax=Portunus trituberculatus TaxID=210409 RepID=A0A5B7DXI7_PORTR|nr:hypothetical protein [Portunus trituberculatus]
MFLSREQSAAPLRAHRLMECHHHIASNLRTGPRAPAMRAGPGKAGMGEQFVRDGYAPCGDNMQFGVFGKTLDISPPPASSPHGAHGDTLYYVLSGVCVADRCVGGNVGACMLRGCDRWCVGQECVVHLLLQTTILCLEKRSRCPQPFEQLT